MRLFFRLAEQTPRPATLLDLGGTTTFWEGVCPDGFSLTILNQFEQQAFEGAELLVGDACDLSRFASKSFDIVFSNSVIGHVGNWERQTQMAREIRRVGRTYFIQTPNRYFPVDWRTLVPFFHWLPACVQAWFFQRVRVGAYKKTGDPDQALGLATRVRDMRRSELESLFPGAAIVPERLVGLPKSFLVHYGFETNGNRCANGAPQPLRC